jgi:YHS domain-containing protein
VKYTVRHILALLVCVMVIACAGTPGKVSQTEPVDGLNVQHGVALKGYDPVAYFAEAEPAAGNPAISYQWQGATWLFSTPEHRTAFMADPAQYAPQFGGYCAFAVSRGTTADGDPHQWAIVGGKLYVNNNAIAKKLWDQDRPTNIVAGDTNWPLIPKRPLATEERSTAVSQTAPATAPK